MSERHETNKRRDEIPPEEDWRTHTTHSWSNTEYPSVSYFQKDEKVWYYPPNRGTFGPYIIISHDGSEMYTIALESNRQSILASVSKAYLGRVS